MSLNSSNIFFLTEKINMFTIISYKLQMKHVSPNISRLQSISTNIEQLSRTLRNLY